MKRGKLLKYLVEQGCIFIREGGNHTVVQNQRNRNQSAVERHREIDPWLVRKICRDLDIPLPAEK